jgi:hypothetical protein
MTVAARRPLRNRSDLNLTISESAGTGERLDTLCGHFVIAPPHDRLLRSYLPPRLVVHAGNDKFKIVRSGTATRFAGLVSLMRGEATGNHLGGRAMLNVLSTAMFALVLRLASERCTGRTTWSGRPSSPGACTGGFVRRTSTTVVAARTCPDYWSAPEV